MVDVVLSLTGPARRPDRRIHAVSRHGELPARHAGELQLAAIPEIDDWGSSLADYRVRAASTSSRVRALDRRLATRRRRAAHRRPAPVAAARRRRPARVPARRRRRLGPGPTPDAARVGRRRRRARGGLRADPVPAEVVDAEPLTGGGLRVTLSDGTVREVGWVVNCTGTSTGRRPGTDPLFDDLLRPHGGVAAGAARHRRAGAGHRRRPAGRLRGLDRGPGLDPGFAAPGRAPRVDRDPRDPQPRPASSRSPCSTRCRRCRAGWPTADWSAATTRWRVRATRSVCRCPRPPRRRRPTTPASNA